MYNLRERRTRYFKEQNGVVRRKQRSQGDSCLSEVSSVNTLVDDDDDEGVYSDSNCGEGEDPHFSSCEENSEISKKMTMMMMTMMQVKSRTVNQSQLNLRMSLKNLCSTEQHKTIPHFEELDRMSIIAK